jgi:hypothetical protein
LALSPPTKQTHEGNENVEKPCIECGINKSVTEFYAHQMMRDGTVNVCKTCHKARMKRRRLTDPRVQEYDRLRYQQPGRKAATRKSTHRWNDKHPLAYKAHYTVSNAIRDGRLIKQPCTICGEEKVHAHHRDYSKPLDVTWLCVTCHQRIHAAFPELNGHH